MGHRRSQVTILCHKSVLLSWTPPISVLTSCLNWALNTGTPVDTSTGVNPDMGSVKLKIGRLEGGGVS